MERACVGLASGRSGFWLGVESRYRAGGEPLLAGRLPSWFLPCPSPASGRNPAVSDGGALRHWNFPSSRKNIPDSKPLRSITSTQPQTSNSSPRREYLKPSLCIIANHHQEANCPPDTPCPCTPPAKQAATRAARMKRARRPEQPAERRTRATHRSTGRDLPMPDGRTRGGTTDGVGAMRCEAGCVGYGAVYTAVKARPSLSLRSREFPPKPLPSYLALQAWHRLPLQPWPLPPSTSPLPLT